MNFPIPRRSLFHPLLGMTLFLGPAPAGPPLATPESVRSEYPRALAALEARYAHCRGEGIYSSFRKPTKEGKYQSQVQAKATFAFSGGNGLLITSSTGEGDRPGVAPPEANAGGTSGGQRVKVYNEKYSFLLTRKDTESDYLIQSLDEGSASGRRMIFVGPGCYVRAAAMAHYFPIADLMARKGFRIDRVVEVESAPGPRQLRIEFSVPLAPPKPQAKPNWLQLTSGWFVVSPEEQWILHEYGYTTTYSSSFRNTAVGHVQYERGPTGQLQPVKADHLVYATEFSSDPGSDPSVIPGGGEDFRFTKLEFADTPERDFTLGAFGLPEYGQTAPRRAGISTPWWIFGAALVALVVAVILRRLSVRPRPAHVA